MSYDGVTDACRNFAPPNHRCVRKRCPALVQGGVGGCSRRLLTGRAIEFESDETRDGSPAQIAGLFGFAFRSSQMASSIKLKLSELSSKVKG